MSNQTHVLEPKLGCCKKCQGLRHKVIMTKVWKIESNGNTYEIGTTHKLYGLRYTLMSRCYNAKPSEYKWYQGKGIQVFNEWKEKPESFFQWSLDNGWKDGLTIDRIDAEKHYEPNNCRFVPMKFNLQQMHKIRKMNGENSPHAKLTLKNVEEIRNKLKLGVTSARLANDFKVARSTISAIKRNVNWKG